jgi:predicted HAD superfamily phosphohydrolase YqeG
VRGALSDKEGFTNVKTDVDNRIVSFDYSNSEAELMAKLEELGKSNEHLSGWSKK